MALPQQVEKNRPQSSHNENIEPPHRQGTTTEGLLTTEEVLVSLGISHPTLRIRIARGYFHPIKKKPGINSKNYFHPDEVEAERKRVADLNAASSKIWAGRKNTHVIEKLADKLEKKAREKSEALEAPRASRPPDSNDNPPAAPPTSSPYEGEIASKAFSLFEKSVGVRTAVIELKQSVTVVKYLYNEWKNLGPEWLVSEADVKTLRSMLKWNEDPPTFQGFLRAFNDMIVKRAEDVARERAEEIAREMMKNLVRQPVPAASISETPGPNEDSVSQAEREALEKIDE